MDSSVIYIRVTQEQVRNLDHIQKERFSSDQNN